MGNEARVTAALDTSGGAALALARDGDVFWRDFLASSGRESDRELLGWLESSLTRAGVAVGEIAAWTVGTGPGSFSGLRVGLALVAGICLPGQIPHRGVPSSLALALAAVNDLPDGALVGVLHDARRGQLIFSGYCWLGGALEPVGEPQVLTPETLLPTLSPCVRLVTAQADAVTPLVPELCADRLQTVAQVDAALLLAPPGHEWPTDAAACAATFQPVYVRPPVFIAPVGALRTVGGAGGGKD